VVSWSPDGTRLAAVADRTTVKFWDLKRGPEVLTLKGHSGWVLSISWSTDGRRLATFGADRAAKIWNAESSDDVRVLRHYYTEQIGEVAFLPKRDRLVTMSPSKIKVWDTTTWKESSSFGDHKSPSLQLACCPDGRRIATINVVELGVSNSVKIWDVDTSREIHRFDRILEGSGPHSLTWSADGRYLATVSAGSKVHVWDAETGAEVRSLQGGKVPVSWSPDGRYLASGGGPDRLVNRGNPTIARAESPGLWLWDAATGAELRVFKCDPVKPVAWSPDGKRLVTNTLAAGSSPKVWDVSSGVELFTLIGHSERVWTCAWSPDGKRLASGGGPLVKIWDAANGVEILTLKENIGVKSLSWSSDGKLLAGGSSDSTIRIWDSSWPGTKD